MPDDSDSIDDLLETYLDAARDADDTIDVDVPLPDVDELLGETGRPNVDELDELGLLEAVMRRGSLRVREDAMQIKCPAYSSPATCGLMMLWHPATGDPLPVCNGPSVRRKRKFSLLAWETKEWYDSDRAHHSCPYHPKRINEPPAHRPDPTATRGWLSDR